MDAPIWILVFVVLVWPILVLGGVGFLLGRRGPAWSRRAAMFGLPGVVAAVGTWRALVADLEPDPASPAPSRHVLRFGRRQGAQGGGRDG